MMYQFPPNCVKLFFMIIKEILSILFYIFSYSYDMIYHIYLVLKNIRLFFENHYQYYDLKIFISFVIIVYLYQKWLKFVESIYRENYLNILKKNYLTILNTEQMTKNNKEVLGFFLFVCFFFFLSVFFYKF